MGGRAEAAELAEGAAHVERAGDHDEAARRVKLDARQASPGRSRGWLRLLASTTILSCGIPSWSARSSDASALISGAPERTTNAFGVRGVEARAAEDARGPGVVEALAKRDAGAGVRLHAGAEDHDRRLDVGEPISATGSPGGSSTRRMSA